MLLPFIGAKLSGFSPVETAKQVGDWAGVYGDNRQGSNYDTFSKINTNSTPQVQGTSTATSDPYAGSTYYDSNSGQMMQWTGSGYAPASAGGSQVGGNTTSTFRTGTGSGGGGTTAPAYDPTEMLFLDTQLGTILDRIGRLPGQKKTAKTNLDESLLTGQAAIDTDRANAKGAYDSNVLTSSQDYTNSRAGIRQESGNLFNSLQRLLGAAGAGRSSAANVLAPFAVGKEAASRFGQTQDAFGKNMSALDNSWAMTDADLTKARTELDDDWRNKDRELGIKFADAETGLINQKTDLELNKAQLQGGGIGSIQSILDNSTSSIKSLLDTIDSLSANYTSPSLKTTRTAFKAPELSKYNYSRFQAPSLQGGNAGVQDYLRPFVNAVPREDDERLQVR